MTRVVAVLAGLALAGAAPASAQHWPTPTVAPKPTTYWQKNGCDAPVKRDRYDAALRRTFRYSAPGGNFIAKPVRKAMVQRLRELRKCSQSQKFRDNRYQRMLAFKRAWRWYHRIDVITVYGKWSIPPGIVNCESGGSWTAYNPSGASGPYQLLGWGAPMPANTPARQAVHHVIAARLWAGGAGAHHWAASRHCWG